jgi:hypothetical protein
MQGNTQLLKHARMATKAVLPANFVEWNLPGFWRALDYFFQHIYGEAPHPAHGEPPGAYLRQLLNETGLRRVRLAHLNDTLMILSCPCPETGGNTRRVDNKRGIKIDSFWYWNDIFKCHGLDRAFIEVRVEPWDASIVYGLVNGNWYRCISRFWSQTRTYTRLEVHALFEEVQARQRFNKREIPLYKLKEWLKLLDNGHFKNKLLAEIGEEREMCEELGLIESSSQVFPVNINNSEYSSSITDDNDTDSLIIDNSKSSIEELASSETETTGTPGDQNGDNYLF